MSDILAGPPKVPPSEVGLPPEERFPREMLFKFTDNHQNPDRPTVTISLLEAMPNAFPDGPVENYYQGRSQGFTLGEPIGDPLDDNSWNSDGYRFHDALHIATGTITGWSAVLRKLLCVKRRSLSDVDRIEDGGRAIAVEEQLFVRLGIGTVQGESSAFADLTMIMAISETRQSIDRMLPEGTFIGHREWEKAIKVGYNVLYLLRNSIGVVDEHAPAEQQIRSAYVHADLDRKEIRFSAESPEAARAAEPVEPINPLFFSESSFEEHPEIPLRKPDPKEGV